MKALIKIQQIFWSHESLRVTRIPKSLKDIIMLRELLKFKKWSEEF